MGDQTTITVRLDDSLKREVEAAAATEDLSLTQLVVQALRERVGGRCRSCGRPARTITVPAVPPIDRGGMATWVARWWPAERRRVTFSLHHATRISQPVPLSSTPVVGARRSSAEEIDVVVNWAIQASMAWAVTMQGPQRFTLSVTLGAASAPADQFVFVVSPIPAPEDSR